MVATSFFLVRKKECTSVFLIRNFLSLMLTYVLTFSSGYSEFAAYFCFSFDTCVLWPLLYMLFSGSGWSFVQVDVSSSTPSNPLDEATIYVWSAMWVRPNTLKKEISH